MSAESNIPASILVVEDNEGSIVTLRALLEPLGHALHVATSGEDALKRLLHDDFAVVLMDVKLPGIDGYETAALMRGIRRTRMTPIIFLTGVYRETAEVMRGYDKGAVDYLVKPYDPDILRSKVSVFVELYQARIQLEALTKQEAARLIEEAEHARVVEKESERRLFEAVLRQMPAGLVIAQAPRGELLLSNQTVHEIFGTDVTSARAWCNEDGTAREYETPVARVLRTGAPAEDDEVCYQRSDGVRRLSLSAAPIFDEDKRMVAVVGTVVDVTAKHDAQQERERLIRALEQSNATLETFAYVASHDLKAPLRGISNLSDWIEESLGASAEGQVRDYLALLRDRVQRMSSLVDGILRYARAGGDTTTESVSMPALLTETIDLLQPSAKVRIDVDCPLLEVSTSKVGLQQILLNLIGNAIKHADREDAHVRVHCMRDGDTLNVTIADNGPGIPERAKNRIWDVFYSGSRAPDSTGIGLAVVKRILDQRGGKTWVESEEGKGAVFHVQWPL